MLSRSVSYLPLEGERPRELSIIRRGRKPMGEGGHLPLLLDCGFVLERSPLQASNPGNQLKKWSIFS